jgi:hypothetical protein
VGYGPSGSLSLALRQGSGSGERRRDSDNEDGDHVGLGCADGDHVEAGFNPGERFGIVMTKMGRCRDLMYRDGEMKWMYSRAHKVVAVVGEKARSFGKVT